MPAAIQTHHDDHHGGSARSAAAGAGAWNGLRVAPAPGLYHGGRPDLEPGAAVVYDASHLPLLGRIQRQDARPAEKEARCSRAGGGGIGCACTSWGAHMKILLVEDNERVSESVVKGLQEAGHTTDHAANGREGMFLGASEPYDVIIMDRMLPGDIDGLAIVEVLRKAGKRTPILILSALSEVDDRIRGLRSGGDDYLTKPFAFGELLARIDALHRRSQGNNRETTLDVGDLHMDPLTRKVSRGDRPITLQPR